MQWRIQIEHIPILPSQGSGPLRLGMTFDEITEHIDAYDQRELANTTQLICEIRYSYHEELGVYLPDGIDGMCAELDDGCNLDDDAPWNE